MQNFLSNLTSNELFVLIIVTLMVSVALFLAYSDWRKEKRYPAGTGKK